MFVNAFCSEQFEVVESKTFIVRLLNEYRAQLSTTFVVSTSWTSAKPQRPTAPGKRLRLDAAPRGCEQGRGEGCAVLGLKRRRGGCHGQQWPGAPEEGPEIPSPTWGTSESVSGLKFVRDKFCICSKCLEKVHPKKFAIDFQEMF